MMRVGTQKSKKSNSTSPILSPTYRHSPTSGLNHSSRLNTSSPISNFHSSSNHYSTKSNMASSQEYRQTASPVYGDSGSKFYSSKVQSSQTYRQTASPIHVESSKYNSSSDFHKMSSAEKRILSGSPSLIERSRQSPSYMDRQRIGSPSFGSSEHTSTKKISERRVYETSSPVMSKQIYSEQDYNTKYDNESSFTNKMSSMRISESRSPIFMNERSSPSLNYNSRFEKHESKTYNSSSFDDGVDTSPLIKVSSNDRATARRDSWDAISKTKGLLSHRSLESVANLADKQLESELSHKHDSSYRTEEHFSRDNSYMQHSERYQTQSKLGARKGGAPAVKVQPVPDGVVGQPVEFESKISSKM